MRATEQMPIWFPEVEACPQPSPYVQPRVGFAYAPRGGKLVIRAGFGLFRGPWDSSDLMVGWQGASAFTSMNNPLVPDFDTANGVVGLGPSGIVGVSGPFLASKAFRSFATTGAYPSPDDLQQFPLGYILSTEASIESFNLFNHRNVQSIDQVYGAADFLGPMPHQFGDGISSPANPNFATPNFTGPARQLQASVRFNF